MSSVVDSVGSLFGSESDGSKAARHGMERQMNYQDEGLQYLQDADRLPKQLRESSLGKLGGLYGVGEEFKATSVEQLIEQIGGSGDFRRRLATLKGPLSEMLEGVLSGENRDRSATDLIGELGGGAFNKQMQQSGLHGILTDLIAGEYDDTTQSQGEVQQGMIDQARQSPLYGAIMGGQKAGEEGILRHQGMTGGFRSGDTQENLYDYNVQLQNRALLNSYNQQLMGLQGMANLPSNANAIANQYNTMGGTIGAGTVGIQQSQAAAQEQGMGYIMSAGNAAMGGMGGGGMPSFGGGGGAASGGGAYGTQGIFGSGGFGKGF